MSTEYHKLVKTYNGKDNFQVFVFRFDRDEESVCLLDMWVLTSQNGSQSRVHIQVQNLAENVYYNQKDRMSEVEIDKLFDVFSDIHVDSIKNERDLEKVEQIVQSTLEDEYNKLIEAGEMALQVHPINQSFDELIKLKNNSQK